MKNLIILLSMIAIAGCSKIEPIEVIAPQRQIDTKSMEQFKSNLEQRKISVGLIYEWGQADRSNLMHTPDSLDIIVVKGGYQNMSSYQKEDLANTQKLKATKVLLGADLQTLSLLFEEQLEKKTAQRRKEKEEELRKANPAITAEALKAELDKASIATTDEMAKAEAAKMKTFAAEIITIMQKEKFSGISVEIPQNLNAAYSVENIKAFLEAVNKVAGKGKSAIFMVENPLKEAKEIINNAQWVVHRQTVGKLLFSSFDNAAEPWPASRFLPSADFSREDIAEGFADSQTFVPGGPLPQTVDVINWKGATMAGAAFYHIEKNYTDVAGKTTYAALRYSIGKLQLKNKK